MLPHPNLLKEYTTFVFTSNSDLKHLRGRKTLRMLGIDCLTPGQLSKVSNLGLFGMTVWVSGNSGFFLTDTHTDTQTVANFVIRLLIIISGS